MRANGTNGFPKPRLLPQAETITIRTRDNNDLPLRIIRANGESKGVLLHFHSGMSLASLHRALVSFGSMYLSAATKYILIRWLGVWLCRFPGLLSS